MGACQGEPQEARELVDVGLCVCKRSLTYCIRSLTYYKVYTYTYTYISIPVYMDSSRGQFSAITRVM